MTALSVLVIILCVIACEKNDQSVNQASPLVNAHNLAHLTGGFYSEPVPIGIKKTIENDQGVIHLSFSNKSINPYLIKVFVEKSQYEEINVEPGSYKILFMKNVLILNQPKTGRRHDFIIDNEGLTIIKTQLPQGYLSKTAIYAIGMSVFGSLAPLHEAPDLSPDDGCTSSGGPGSTSCSNTCCSVSCESGYYVSCGNSCNCIKKSKAN